MKPRIKKVRGKWICCQIGLKGTGSGIGPADAYFSWRRLVYVEYSSAHHGWIKPTMTFSA